MDYHRFDNLTRALAIGGSRRTALRGLAAGLVAAVAGGALPRRAAAQQNVPIGGRCSAFGANAECSQAGTPAGGVAVICSDNGVARDGQFNCCRNAGGVCSADFHCCGAAFCQNGICGGGAAPAPTPAPGGTGLALGAECSATTQCSQAGGSVVCADNGLATDGAKNCCRNQGGSCSADSNCCASLYCVNGVCGAAAASGSLALAAQCSTSEQCSQAGGAVVCADNGYANDGALNCCRQQGGACFDSTYSRDCCFGLYCVSGVCTDTASGSGGLALGAQCSATGQCSQAGGSVVCADNGLATDGSLNCCRNQGGACTTDTGCCGGLACVGGTCGSSVASGSLQLGATCSAESQCSQAGGYVACADNGIAADGALNCCRYQGGTCFSTGGCCLGLDCIGGVCSPVNAQGGDLPLGAACTVAEQCSQAGGAVACADNGLATDGALNCCRYQGGACGADAGCCAGLLCRDGVCA